MLYSEELLTSLKYKQNHNIKIHLAKIFTIIYFSNQKKQINYSQGVHYFILFF